MNAVAEERLSVIIPALDEASGISAAITSAWAIGADEVIVSDGGSTDATREVACAFRARVVSSERGRGVQLHNGALAAQGGILLFLHADAALPATSKKAIQALLAGADAGFFRLCYDHESWMLRMVAGMANLRSQLFSLPYGDQALFLRRSLYESMGGFQRYPFLEDIDLVRRIKRKHTMRCMPSCVTVSARRLLKPFPCAPLLLSFRNVIIALLFCLGVHPDRLVRFYR